MWFNPCGASEDQNKRCREFTEEGNCIRQTRCEGKYGSQGFESCKPKFIKPEGAEISLPSFSSTVPDSNYRWVTPNCDSMDADHISETVNEQRNCTQSIDVNHNACFYDGSGFDSCEITQNNI